MAKIRLGAVVDPGTTVANKTGGWRTYKPIFISKNCRKCRRCNNYCPEGVVYLDEEKFPYADLAYCKGCGICAHECPGHKETGEKAIIMELEEK
ncbi:MAG: 4Fe-4S dicluster domain-containing protein [Candidatus Hodarchaeota archaeon]